MENPLVHNTEGMFEQAIAFQRVGAHVHLDSDYFRQSIDKNGLQLLLIYQVTGQFGITLDVPYECNLRLQFGIL